MGDRLVERTDERVDIIDETLRDRSEGGGLGAGPSPFSGRLLARLGERNYLPRDRVGGGREHLEMHGRCMGDAWEMQPGCMGLQRVGVGVGEGEGACEGRKGVRWGAGVPA